MSFPYDENNALQILDNTIPAKNNSNIKLDEHLEIDENLNLSAIMNKKQINDVQ